LTDIGFAQIAEQSLNQSPLSEEYTVELRRTLVLGSGFSPYYVPLCFKWGSQLISQLARWAITATRIGELIGS